ncbi:MAG TPA: tripartite tricarboxylate transporter substrate binding protein [Burkholderiales bacterium]|nr:tripartite tricarboxylate transporter substrate binding protein [Burkholderiales bacterium]
MTQFAKLVLVVAAVGFAASGCVHDARAQAYPVRPIRLIVSVQPGGNLDLMGRSVADKVSEGLGQRMYVENRPGANSTIGFASAARAAPDGYTLIMVAQSALVAARMMRNPPYDPVRDFAGVSLIATLPQMLVVHPSFPVKSVKEFVALAKAHPGEVNCATSGNGSGSHLALELFSRMADVRIMRIPYNGDGPAIIDLLGGQVPVKFDNLSTSLAHVRGGKLRALGVTSPARSALLPDVPAISETVPGFQASIFNGMLAPAATPTEILARVHTEIVKFVQSPEIRNRFASQGVELQASTSPAQFTAYIKTEYTRWAKVIDDAGIKAE